MSPTVRHGYRGYVSARPFGGYNIPVPVQNAVLRDYCAHNKLLFMLPVNENIFPNSYMVMDGLIRDLRAFEGVVMCSMHMLPTRRERRQAVIMRILEQECVLHFALEATVVRTVADALRVEDLISLSRILPGDKQLDVLRQALTSSAEPLLDD
jgi:sporadic carbohydrate cluster protein (TIGR04323 family)